MFNRIDPRLDPDDDDNFYKQTHKKKSGEEKLKSRLYFKPCRTPSHLQNVDWLDISEDDLLCNGGKSNGFRHKIVGYCVLHNPATIA